MNHITRNTDGTATTDPLPTMPVRILNWRPVHRPPIVGSFDCILGKNLEIRGSRVMQTNGTLWVAFEGKPKIGPDGQALRDARGKVDYATILKWTDRAAADRFRDSVLAAITRQFGANALTGGAQ
jgi:hypothetical protein